MKDFKDRIIPVVGVLSLFVFVISVFTLIWVHEWYIVKTGVTAFLILCICYGIDKK